MCIKVADLGDEALINCCKTCMSSKLIGSEADFFSNLVIESVQRVKTVVTS